MLDAVGFVRVGTDLGSEAVDAVALGAGGEAYVLGTIDNGTAGGEGASVLGQAYDSPFGGLFLARLRPGGDVEWIHVLVDDEARAGESSAPPQGIGLTLDGAGDLIVTGVIRNNIDLGDGLPAVPDGIDEDVATFVAKYTPEGEIVWSRRYWGGDFRYAWPSAPKVDADDNIVFLGIRQGRADFGDGALDNFETALIKLDTNGELVFARGLGLPSAEAERSLEVAAFELDTSGEIVFSAVARGIVDLGDGYVVGAANTWSTLFVRVSANGAIVAARAFADETTLGRATGMARTADGDFIVAGYSAYGVLLEGGFLARLAPEGTPRWWIETDPDLAPGLLLDDHPNYGLSSFAVDGEGRPIVLTARGVAGYDPDGSPLWRYEFDRRPVRSRVVVRDSEVALFGRADGSFEFAGNAIDLEGAQWFRWDGYVLRFTLE